MGLYVARPRLISKQRQYIAMELEELSRQATHLSQQIQVDLKAATISTATRPDDAPRPSVEAALERIERRLIALHGHTDSLVRRIPPDLTPLLQGIQAAAAERCAATPPGSVAPSARESPAGSTIAALDLEETVEQLTPQERRVFEICFQSGFLTYKDIAHQLDTTATTAKNIVNRIFRDPNKARLFHKKQRHGIASVALDGEVEKRILGTRAREFRNNGLTENPRPSLPHCREHASGAAGGLVLPPHETRLKQRAEVF